MSSVLNGERDIRVNITLMRAFVQWRVLLASREELVRKLAALEKTYDAQFRVVFDAVRQLRAPLVGRRPTLHVLRFAPSR